MAAKDEPNVVRLVNSKTGVVVTTTEENANRLSGFEPEKAKSAAKNDSK